jgi:hypothetical protein
MCGTAHCKLVAAHGQTRNSEIRVQVLLLLESLLHGKCCHGVASEDSLPQVARPMPAQPSQPC